MIEQLSQLFYNRRRQLKTAKVELGGRLAKATVGE